MNDVDFPVARGARRHRCGARLPGSAPVKVNMVVKRGVNEDGDPGDGRALPRHGRDPALHRVHGRRATNGWRLDEVVPAAEIVRELGARWPLEPLEAELPRRGRERTATSTAAARSASSPPSRSPSAATARARASPPKASSTPASSRPAATTCARCCAAGADAELAEQLRGLWRMRADRYSELRTREHHPRPPKRRDVPHRRLTPPPADRPRGTRRAGRGPGHEEWSTVTGCACPAAPVPAVSAVATRRAPLSR